MNPAPIPPTAGPLFCNVNHGQIQHLQQAIVGGENRLGLGHFAQLAVKALNGVGRIDQTPHLLRVFEIGAEVGPVFPPGSGDLGILLVPVFPKGIQGIQSSLLVDGGVDSLQISH